MAHITHLLSIRAKDANDAVIRAEREIDAWLKRTGSPADYADVDGVYDLNGRCVVDPGGAPTFDALVAELRENLRDSIAGEIDPVPDGDDYMRDTAREALEGLSGPEAFDPRTRGLRVDDWHRPGVSYTDRNLREAKPDWPEFIVLLNVHTPWG
jgi:hypothetical protein